MLPYVCDSMTIGIGAPRHTAGNKEPCPPFGGGTRFSGYGPGYLGSREPRRDEVRTVRDVPVYSGGKGVAVPEGTRPSRVAVRVRYRYAGSSSAAAVLTGTDSPGKQGGNKRFGSAQPRTGTRSGRTKRAGNTRFSGSQPGVRHGTLERAGLWHQEWEWARPAQGTRFLSNPEATEEGAPRERGAGSHETATQARPPNKDEPDAWTTHARAATRCTVTA